jgi:hypothetical protein
MLVRSGPLPGTSGLGWVNPPFQHMHKCPEICGSILRI